MGKIKLTSEIVKAIKNSGLSASTIIADNFVAELEELRNDPRLKGMSETKLAIIDAGFRGNTRVSNFFTSEENKFLFQVYMADAIEVALQKSDIMQYLVGGEQEIEGTVAEAPILDMGSAENKKKLRRKRVAEGGQFPITEISVGSGAIKLYKKGIQLKQTYEAARRMTIDLFSKAIEAVTNDIVDQNVEDAVAVLEGGKLNELLTTGTANTITNQELLKALLAYIKEYGYAPTTIMANDDIYESLFTMVYDTKLMSGMGEQIKMKFPNVKLEDLNVILAPVTAANGKNRALLYNKNYTLTRYVERGSSLQEQGNNIENQTNNVVISEVSGYGIFVSSVGVIKSA